MFSKVYETLYETVHENILDNDFRKFDEWYRENGADYSETRQLMYILESPEIENSTKRALVTRLTDKSAALEEEEDVLVKVGFSSEKFQEHIKSSAETIRERCRRNYLRLFAVGVALIICYFIFSMLSGSPTFNNSGLISPTATCCFGIAMICFMRAWDSKIKFDRAEVEAREDYEMSVGRALQERIAEIEKEREEFYKLDKVIAKMT